MEIYSFESLPSTQRWLLDRLAEGAVTPPCAVITDRQTQGIGSRGNRWIGRPGNFFASVALKKSNLPGDLPLCAASIYFAYLMRVTLFETGSKVWLKWPNDFYLKDRKIGGCITTVKGDAAVAGIGINLVDAPRNFGVLDINITPETLLRRYLDQLKKGWTWKQIFSRYRLEFEQSRAFCTHWGEEEIDMAEALLNEDGSLTIGNRRVVSRR